MEETIYKIVLAIGGIGLFLIYLGWFRRRYDGGSYCRGCGYRVDRSGENVRRCSECGADLSPTGQVLPYQRNRSHLLVLVGLLLATGAGFVVITDATRQISAASVYRLLPNWVLLRADVSLRSDYADEQVAILRHRVQINHWSEKQLTEFTHLLCIRATNLHRRPFTRGMQYTGMTMSLLKDYKPSEAEVDDLLEALVGKLIEESGILVDRRDGITSSVFVPELRCDPQRPFLRATDLTSVRMRGEIVACELVQDGIVVTPTTHAFVPGRGWISAFDHSALAPGKPRELHLTINWYIEDETLPLPGPAGDSSAGSTANPPWHTFELICDLRLETSADLSGQLNFGRRSVQDSRNKYLLRPRINEIN